MLSFGQLIEEGNDVETCVLQQAEPQGCGEQRTRGQGLPHTPKHHDRFLPTPFPRPLARVTRLLGSLSFFTFLLSLKYSARLLLGG